MDYSPRTGALPPCKMTPIYPSNRKLIACTIQPTAYTILTHTHHIAHKLYHSKTHHTAHNLHYSKTHDTAHKFIILKHNTQPTTYIILTHITALGL